MKKAILIIIAVLAFLGIATTVTAEVIKRSDPVTDETAFGSYIDESKEKDAAKTIVLDGEELTLTYVNTENNSDLPVEKRADKYGTYDIYATDDEDTQFWFLLDTDIFCGFLRYNTRLDVPKSERIDENTAKKIAEDYISEIRDGFSDYRELTVVYQGAEGYSGYYDVQYYKPIDGYQSDDILRVWVTDDGEVKAFLEYNYKRYDGVEISDDKVKKASSKIERKLKSFSEFTLGDLYIAMNDKGDFELVQVVDYFTPSGDGGAGVTQRELIKRKL